MASLWHSLHKTWPQGKGDMHAHVIGEGVIVPKENGIAVVGLEAAGDGHGR
jgi:hypothetical protein